MRILFAGLGLGVTTLMLRPCGSRYPYRRQRQRWNGQFHRPGEPEEKIARPRTGASPHEVALSPDGKTVVVVSYREDGYIGEELNVFDVATASTDEDDPDRAASGAARDCMDWRHGQRYRHNRGNPQCRPRRYRRPEQITGSVATNKTGSHLLALSPDSSTAYVTSGGSDAISVIDLDAMSLEKTIAGGDGPEADRCQSGRPHRLGRQ